MYSLFSGRELSKKSSMSKVDDDADQRDFGDLFRH